MDLSFRVVIGVIILLLVVNVPRCWYGETIDHRSTIPVMCFYKSQKFLSDNQIYSIYVGDELTNILRYVANGSTDFLNIQ